MNRPPLLLPTISYASLRYSVTSLMVAVASSVDTRYPDGVQFSPSSDRDGHFSEVRAACHVTQCFCSLVKRERLVDHRLHFVDGNRVAHRLQVFDRPDGDALQTLLLHDHQRQTQFGRDGPASTPIKAMVPPIRI